MFVRLLVQPVEDRLARFGHQDVAVQQPGHRPHGLGVLAAHQRAKLEVQVLSLRPLAAIDQEDVAAREQQHPPRRMVLPEDGAVEQVLPRRIRKPGPAIRLGQLLGQRTLGQRVRLVRVLGEGRFHHPQERVAVVQHLHHGRHHEVILDGHGARAPQIPKGVDQVRVKRLGLLEPHRRIGLARRPGRCLEVGVRQRREPLRGRLGPALLLRVRPRRQGRLQVARQQRVEVMLRVKVADVADAGDVEAHRLPPFAPCGPTSTAAIRR
jgi:hypothetical protein